MSHGILCMLICVCLCQALILQAPPHPVQPEFIKNLLSTSLAPAAVVCPVQPLPEQPRQGRLLFQPCHV